MTTPRILKLHMHGDDVRAAQQALIHAGYGAWLGSAQDDENFGKHTRRAVRKFQSAHGLAATGIIDATTLATLNAASPVSTVNAAPLHTPLSPFAHLPGIHAIAPLPVAAGPRPLIVLDPGHGEYVTETAIVPLGKRAGDIVTDTGAEVTSHGRTIEEKDLNLAISHRLRAALVKRGFAVELTRDADDDVLPTRFNARIETGKGEKVLHLSVHADSGPVAASGLTIYTHPHLRDDPFSPAVRFAHALSDPGHKLGKSERMAMLNPRLMGDIPAALAEVGNMNNPADLARLTTAKGQQQIADQLADRIAAYYAQSMCVANANLPKLGTEPSSTLVALGHLPVPPGGRPNHRTTGL